MRKGGGQEDGAGDGDVHGVTGNQAGHEARTKLPFTEVPITQPSCTVVFLPKKYIGVSPPLISPHVARIEINLRIQIHIQTKIEIGRKREKESLGEMEKSSCQESHRIGCRRISFELQGRVEIFSLSPFDFAKIPTGGS